MMKICVNLRNLRINITPETVLLLGIGIGIGIVSHLVIAEIFIASFSM